MPPRHLAARARARSLPEEVEEIRTACSTHRVVQKRIRIHSSQVRFFESNISIDFTGGACFFEFSDAAWSS